MIYLLQNGGIAKESNMINYTNTYLRVTETNYR